ncbi:MAG: hypothetical protein H0T46_37220 [Deltaproteobacteria bacterium]|nr:hypothetical protein [Deltaproteobacteria bacterium]
MTSPIRRFALAVLIMGAAGGIAATDTAAPATPPPPPAASAKVQAMSPAELKTSADGIQAQIKEDYQHVLRLQGIARKQKDVIKLNCVNDKLVQLKVQMNLADTSYNSLVANQSKGEEASGMHAQLQATGHSVKELREAANACIGELELKRESPIEVQSPEITDDPGVIDPYNGEQGVVVEPPGYASPFH